jgi:hypothetical protein
MSSNERKRFIRPKAEILNEKATIPAQNLITPPPNQFTHALIGPSPFYYSEPDASGTPDGEFKAGTKVALLVYNGGPYSRVVDGQGLYVAVAYSQLKKL